MKNRFYSDAVEYLTCKFDEYTSHPILDEKGRIQERDSYLIEGINCGVDTFGVSRQWILGRNGSPPLHRDIRQSLQFTQTDTMEARTCMSMWCLILSENMKQSIRGNKLGDGYGKAELTERIAQMLAKRKEMQEVTKRIMAEAKAREEKAAEERRQLEKKLEEERKQSEI